MTKEVADERPILVPNYRRMEQLTQLRLPRVRKARVCRRILSETGQTMNSVLLLLCAYNYPYHPTVLQRLRSYEDSMVALMEQMKILRAEERTPHLCAEEILWRRVSEELKLRSVRSTRGYWEGVMEERSAPR
ncbi:hypothetical protein N7517_004707 [Penicillium concentricum]|uniref:Uncharacterized protein n=1 Tax=Penicillium concentricum TaxID=293559 RepID=A0A9W9VAY2_9EURO|nr:uncharacterized protein N7517_004707 [Penicillium concentricum]KAJ5372701.1 hypothetical protein N7517_004707 [Penicillium concentricum]